MKDQEIYCYTLTAKTDIRTGSAAGRKDPFQNTGILGSIRWWFEILIRGLEGGSACDPNDSKTRCSGTSRCTVCELFGCTGWARKFRFEVLEEDKSAPRKTAIKKDDTFHLKFIPLRPIAQEEWDLLKAALWLIGEYGALGGKTGCINQPHGFVTHGTKSPQPRLNPMLSGST